MPTKTNNNSKLYPVLEWRKRWVQKGGKSVLLHRVASMVNDDWEAGNVIPIGGHGICCLFRL